MNNGEVKNRIERLGYDYETLNKIYTSEAFKELPKHLLDSEIIYYIGIASLPSEKVASMIFSDVLLIITDKRLFIIAKRMIGTDIKEFIYNRIDSIECSTMGTRVRILQINTYNGTTSIGVGDNINYIRELIYDGINGTLRNRKVNDMENDNISFTRVEKDEQSLLIKLMRENDISFGMQIEEIFFIKGRGTVVVGTVAGYIDVGDNVDIVEKRGNAIKEDVVVIGIEKNRKLVDSASTGESVGVLLGTNENGIEVGQYIFKV